MPSTRGKLLKADHLKTGLKVRALRGAATTLSSQAFKVVLQVGSIAALARLLDPSDFGLFAMVAVFTGLALPLMDGGLSVATVQREDVSHEQISNLFWVNGALGAGLCLVGVALSPLVAWVYDEPRITLVMATMSFAFLLGGMSVQHDALLRRQMRFKALAVIDISSMAAGIAAGVAGALLNLQYWSLVVGALVTVGVKGVMRWFTVRWIPSFIKRGSGTLPLLKFGASVTAANALGYVAASLTPFAIGYLGGTQFLGLFNRAATLTSVPSRHLLPPVLSVVQPTIARVSGDSEKLRRTIASLLGKLTLGTMFATLSIAVLADWIVALFLGSGWEGAVPILRMLAVFTLVEPIAGLLAAALVAVGSAHALLRWKVITLVLLAGSIVIGANWGAPGVVVAYALSGLLIRLPLFLLFASKHLPITIRELLGALIFPLISSVGTSAVLVGLRRLFLLDDPLLGLLVFVPLSALVYMALCLCMRPTRRELLEVLGLAKLLASRERS